MVFRSGRVGDRGSVFFGNGGVLGSLLKIFCSFVDCNLSCVVFFVIKLAINLLVGDCNRVFGGVSCCILFWLSRYMRLFILKVFLILWVIIMVVLECSFFSFIKLCWICCWVSGLRVLKGLFISMMGGLVVSVWVILICCCCLLLSLFGYFWVKVLVFSFSCFSKVLVWVLIFLIF